ncbi:hypothetical protein D1872_235520 [compost metagenome]
MCGWSAYENAYLKRLPFPIGFVLMNSDAPVNLIMQAKLIIRLKFIACELYTVHSQISLHNSLLVRVLTIYLRQRNECPSIHRPMLNQRKVGNLDFFEA